MRLIEPGNQPQGRALLILNSPACASLGGFDVAEPVNDFETPAVRIYCTSISLPSSCFGGLIQTAGGRVESFGGPLMKRSGWVL